MPFSNQLIPYECIYKTMVTTRYPKKETMKHYTHSLHTVVYLFIYLIRVSIITVGTIWGKGLRGLSPPKPAINILLA